MLEDSDILLIGLAATITVLVLATVLIASIVISQNRRRKHHRHVAELSTKHQMEVANARLEATQNIMQDIGRELHDNVGQILTAAQLSMMQLMESESTSPERAQLIVQYLETGIAEVNRLGKTLNVDHWKRKSLFEAIKEQGAQLERLGLAKVQIQSDSEHDNLGDDERTVLYRLYQEVIQNSLKHAQASDIKINLNGEPFHMEISDNGDGFDVHTEYKGTGLQNIHKRSKLIGIQASLDSSPGNGTVWKFSKLN